MDPVSDIKSRLPIEDLVRQYCQLKKSGRNYKCLCPFHTDKNPSLLVSPDKGIAYCFACQTGGDIFSFYQAIEGVDFPQALKELAERVGVELARDTGPKHSKDEKERVRSCLMDALAFYRTELQSAKEIHAYLEKRGVDAKDIEKYQLGFAPNAEKELYDALLKKGHSRTEILAAGLGLQSDFNGTVRDRFRHRLMFPIHDHQGRLIGFGGRTMGNDSAKYMNSPDGILYHKSAVFFGLHTAKESAREKGEIILVEGYFDVLACRRVGLMHTVACCGTALTEEHAKILKRYVDEVILCLDQDIAGKKASERAFCMLAQEGLHVTIATLSKKDPADLVLEDAECLKTCIQAQRVPFIEHVCREIEHMDLKNPLIKRRMLERLITLLHVLQTAVERHHYLSRCARALGTSESALEQDFTRSQKKPQNMNRQDTVGQIPSAQNFSSAEIALGICMLHPGIRKECVKLMMPEEDFVKALYEIVCSVPQDSQEMNIGNLPLPKEMHERCTILLLFCEEHGFIEWSETVARREFLQNCFHANRSLIQKKQKHMTECLLQARREGEKEEEKKLQNEYQELLMTSKGQI
ncbi:DNA primase [Candidatus Peribacteria bacterium RIFCSPHIGHO2_02_FULL_49_16]|nr:MAG: DNA primase [Candidatus Peribacteria bacterium RIFCSPHIGHO2_01_FULL_49_38]OGJ59172.1 MAG: DNA primase [Candidatus Peribacteria bacterium RIFCSPHIGHO2_02_FULL_49_16]